MSDSADIQSKSPHRTEKVLIIFFLLSALLCFLILLRPSLFGFSSRGGQAEREVGDLNRKEGDVRRKASGEIAWHDMMDSQVRVADGDIVFTGPTGNAALHLDIGAQATIFPNSMVVIHSEDFVGNSPWLERLRKLVGKPKTVQRITLEAGTLHLDGLSRDRPVELESNGTFYRLEAGLREASLDLEAVDGLLKIAGESDTQIRLVPISSHQVSSQDQTDGRRPAESGTLVSSIIVAPTRVSTKIFDEENFNYIPVNIQWSTVAGVEKYRVHIFHGKNEIFWHDAVGSSFQFKLTQLDQVPYYYQVSAVLKSSVELTSEKMHLDVDVISPQMTLPETTRVAKARSNVLIAWERTLLTQKYRVQIATDPDFKALKLDREIALNALPFFPKETGSLYVRVKSVSENTESPWSSPLGFQIQ